MPRFTAERLARALASLGICVSARERPTATVNERDYPEIDFG